MRPININRLEKICGNNLTVFQKQAIYEWAKEFENTLSSELKHDYKNEYEEDLRIAIDYFIISITFVLHFGETTKFGKKRLNQTLKDIEATVDMFRKKEYSPKDYIKMLEDDGIDIKIKYN